MPLFGKQREPSSPAPRPMRRGLSMVEVLVCVSIGAMLLTSVAMAFRSSFNSFKDSQQRGQMLNSARGFMAHLTSDIRMCDSALPYDLNATTSATETSQFKSGQMPGSPTSGFSGAGGSGVHGIQLVKTHADSWDPLASPSNPVLISYWFDNTKQQVFMTRQMGANKPSPAALCNFVQTFQIYMLPYNSPPESSVSWAGGYVLQRAVITMTLANKDSNGNRILADGGQDLTLTFSDAACPRRMYPGQPTPPF